MVNKLTIPTMSLGRCSAGHSLADKLDAAQKYGYNGIELFHEDLADLRASLPPSSLRPDGLSEPAQLSAAREISRMCKTRDLEIVCLQPFSFYEGLTDRAEHERRIRELHLWIQLAHELGTDMIQIPANFLPPDHVSVDLDLIVRDLRKVADIGLQASPPIRFAYESLCWSTRVDTWELCWEVVQRVDRPNFGTCLDTFNIAGRIYADPTSPSGKLPNAERAVEQSMANLVAAIDVSKVLYVQVVGAARLQEPLIPGHHHYKPEQPPRMSWSRNCRLFYGEEDCNAYLPIKEIATTVFHRLGFSGWVSLELFNHRMSDKDVNVPEELARRGTLSWAKLVDELGLASTAKQINSSSSGLL